MVDQTNLNAVMMLNGELQQIATALDIFDHHGGRIVNMGWAPSVKADAGVLNTTATVTVTILG